MIEHPLNKFSTFFNAFESVADQFKRNQQSFDNVFRMNGEQKSKSFKRVFRITILTSHANKFRRHDDNHSTLFCKNMRFICTISRSTRDYSRAYTQNVYNITFCFSRSPSMSSESPRTIFSVLIMSDNVFSQSCSSDTALSNFGHGDARSLSENKTRQMATFQTK